MHRITNRGREEAKKIVDRYTGPVFTDKVRKMKMAAVELKYMAGFKAVQPAHYPVPYHYQERLATHLIKLKKDSVIMRLNPSEPTDCILNIAISEKTTQESIRMNIDARPYNKGAKHTRYHVTTHQEARHQLKGAKVFSDFDMGIGFHQVPLATNSQVVFQSHLGLNKIKRLFFGTTNSSGIFHHEVTKVFVGLRGCIMIHCNLLVFGEDESKHNRNMAAMLEGAGEWCHAQAQQVHHMCSQGQVVWESILGSGGVGQSRQDRPHRAGREAGDDQGGAIAAAGRHLQRQVRLRPP